MRISDWSSDVCSSDLLGAEHAEVGEAGRAALEFMRLQLAVARLGGQFLHLGADLRQPLAACIADNRGDQARRRRHCNRDILPRILVQHIALEADVARSKERRAGKDGGSTWRSRG